MKRCCGDSKLTTCPLIERLAFENWYKMNNEVKFIDDCYREIEYVVRPFDIEKGSVCIQLIKLLKNNKVLLKLK